MLNWLAGQRPSESVDRDREDGPETPAPVFAVRAFKHAIFGTPATNPPKQRRNSAVDREATRVSSSRPIRPSITRPKSANDAAALTDYASYPPSPTKGILLTPGTAGGRGKSVTFGDLSQAPTFAADVKGKDASRREQLVTRRQRANSLEETSLSLSSIAEPKADLMQLGGPSSSCAIVDPNHEPTCAAGQYWKREYDIYRENTAAEVRKLLTKQRAAKSFAREKDNQCSALLEELQNERLKIEKLNRTVEGLQSQLEQMQLDLLAARRTSAESTHAKQCQLSSGHDRIDQQTGISSRYQQHASESGLSTVASGLRKQRDVSSSHPPGIDIEFEQHNPSFPSRTRRQQNLERNSLIDAVPATEALPSLASVHCEARRDSLSPDPQDQLKTTRKPLTALSSTLQAAATVAPAKEYLKATVESVLMDEIEVKENVLPSRKPLYHAESSSDTLAEKQILSRDGDVIPPDRVAAARARLAARRQLRVEA